MKISRLLEVPKFDRHEVDQFKRASFSIMLNIAEGSSRFSNKDRKNFMVIARGSAFECSAIIDFLYDNHAISKTRFCNFPSILEGVKIRDLNSFGSRAINKNII